jgi:hypothetical protein
VAGLRELIDGYPNRADRRTLAKALRRRQRDERDELGPIRWEIKVELRVLQVHTERAGVWSDDSELVYLAVRNITWGRFTAKGPLRGLRWRATETLLGTTSDELASLLEPERHSNDVGFLLWIR